MRLLPNSKIIQKIFTANGSFIRSAEGAVIIGFAVAIWQSGGDMTIAIPLILAGVLLGGLIVATTPTLHCAAKIIAAACLVIFFIVDGYCVFWHIVLDSHL